MSTITGSGVDSDSLQEVATNYEQQPPPAKKKRNLPGTPDPSAEVIALPPKTLMATNRFVCEICKKGFQRDQNLQLHRRGHNLPWKLKLRSSSIAEEQVRKRIYVCPEPSCVHHDPCRALGDLTGVKKHFSRKHGEKKWKCDKRSKKYAVQSDWKAHVRTCGSREYKCDCGVVFSRRDSFITHRAFCDATTEENKAGQLVSGSQPLIPASNNTEKATTNPSPISSNTTSNNHFDNFDIKNPNLLLVPQGVSSPTLASSSSSTSSTLFRNHHGRQVPLPATISGNFSATELLMKASQMGATTSTNNSTSMMNMATSTFGHDFSSYNVHLQHQYQIASNNNANNMGIFSGMLCDQSNVGLMKRLEQSVKGGNCYGNYNSSDVNNAKGLILNGKNAGGGGDTAMVDFMGIERGCGGGGSGGGGRGGGGGKRGESLSGHGQQREVVHDEQKRLSKKENGDDDQLANFSWSWG